VGGGPWKLELRDVSKTFASPAGTVQAVERLSLTVATGEFVSIVGPSGCGKSTVLQMAAGLETPTSGAVLVDGQPAGPPGPDRCMVFQHFALFPAKTVTGNIEFGLRMTGVPRERRRTIVREQIERIGLTGFEGSYPHQLSGGMQQRVAIARALALQPAIFLMDEPFGALDAQTRILMQEEIARVCAAERLTVLFVTHSVEEAIFLGDRVVVMTARPGRTKEEVEIPPEVRAGWQGRTVDEAYRNQQFVALRERVWTSVREEIRPHEG
jgi:NitT/TauT family transport system ATP-binding protein